MPTSLQMFNGVILFISHSKTLFNGGDPTAAEPLNAEASSRGSFLSTYQLVGALSFSAQRRPGLVPRSREPTARIHLRASVDRRRASSKSTPVLERGRGAALLRQREHKESANAGRGSHGHELADSLRTSPEEGRGRGPRRFTSRVICLAGHCASPEPREVYSIRWGTPVRTKCGRRSSSNLHKRRGQGGEGTCSGDVRL